MVPPETPSLAVYITSTLSDDLNGYDELDAEMARLSREKPGYPGREALPSAGDEEGVVIYWSDEESLVITPRTKSVCQSRTWVQI